VATVFFNLAQYLLGLSVLFPGAENVYLGASIYGLGRKEIDKILPSGRIFRAR
jgi:ABC-type polysaccharide/polyol phosphate transport system ATPase subunit